MSRETTLTIGTRVHRLAMTDQRGPRGPAGATGTDAVWTELTQAQYDALSPPDPAALYVVIG